MDEAAIWGSPNSHSNSAIAVWWENAMGYRYKFHFDRIAKMNHWSREHVWQNSSISHQFKMTSNRQQGFWLAYPQSNAKSTHCAYITNKSWKVSWKCKVLFTILLYKTWIASLITWFIFSLHEQLWKALMLKRPAIGYLSTDVYCSSDLSILLSA